MKKFVCVLCVAILVIQSFGQDTLSLYFETGRAKITDNHIRVLSTIPTKYDLFDLDSVHYIGSADPTGNFQSNLKLSERRAKNMANYCKHLLPENTKSTISALGVVSNEEQAKSRKVDIVFYFKSDKADETDKETKIADSDSSENQCYYIDYKLLHRSHFRTITKQRKEYVMIESLLPDLRKKQEHYYGTINSDGKFEIHPIKWRYRAMGKDWWKSYPAIATIPKNDFDAYKIFKIEDAPCTACNENFATETAIVNEEKYMHLDTFLMRRIQIKVPFFVFRRNYVNVRAPKEYVYIEDTYFIDCHIANTLNWRTKKGKKKQNYYYSRLPVSTNRCISNITRLMSDCKHKPEPSHCDKCMYSIEGGFVIDESLLLNVEIGGRYFASKFTAYAGLEASKEWRYSRIAAQFALEYNLRYHGALSYQFHFSTFSYYNAKKLHSWASPSSYSLISRYGRLYVGTDLRSGINKEKQPYIEQGLFLGFVSVNYDLFLSRIYIQGGVGVDYLKNLSPTFYPTVQVGVTMRIARLVRF